MMQNVHVDPDIRIDPTKPIRVAVSKMGSTRGARKDVTFDEEITHILTSSTLKDKMEFDPYIFSKLDVPKQVQVTAQSSIFISVVGGGNVPAIFLPEGGHLILFYEHSFLDWDYWENMPHLTVHWIPIEDRDGITPEYLSNFERLLQGIVHTIEQRFHDSVSS